MHKSILWLLTCCLLTTSLKAQEEIFFDFVLPPTGVEMTPEVEMPSPDVEMASDDQMPLEIIPNVAMSTPEMEIATEVPPQVDQKAPTPKENRSGENVPEADNRCAGRGYFDCRRSYCVAVSVVIGVALFVGIVALIVNESNHAHQAH